MPAPLSRRGYGHPHLWITLWIDRSPIGPWPRRGPADKPPISAGPKEKIATTQQLQALPGLAGPAAGRQPAWEPESLGSGLGRDE